MTSCGRIKLTGVVGCGSRQRVWLVEALQEDEDGSVEMANRPAGGLVFAAVVDVLVPGRWRRRRMWWVLAGGERGVQ